MLPRRRQDLPSSWGISIVRLHMFQRRRQDCLHQTIVVRSVALGFCNAKAPTKGLSTLNSMAFGLAVYALPDGLPTYDTRLASSCWSGSTGRGSHPQDSAERFQSCFPTSHSPFPSFAWHKHALRCALKVNGPLADVIVSITCAESL